MFRSLSAVRVSTTSSAAVFILTLAALAAPAPAQTPAYRPGREANANRRARIERQIVDTYSHRWEIGGGGGFLRFRSGEFTQKNSEIAFWMDTTYYLNQKLGLTGEIRGAYGNAKIPNETTNEINTIGNPQISEYPFMAGPTYRFYRKQRYAVSAFLLGGTAIGKFDGDTKGIPATLLGFWPSTNARPAISAGGNLDINIYPNVAFRIAPSYLGTGFGSSWQNNAGFEMGLVVRFGRQK